MFTSPVVINMVGIKANAIDRGSFISLGPTQQIDVFLSIKLNYGYGEETGDGVFFNVPLSIVNDQDVSDSNSVKNSLL
ncbi:hypothetical protein D3H55_09200 [Bacillus salacetis]|uniref:Uncharacterized protein n=1 Tax=Bacillus salacetis TaxID=2315464 RepID=A0A3A1QZX1_9BACI|nr:hypothetical protein [Bacillus salacetis]RIW34680.1 hypothetical protein D3H55_09200 [Bacillus salacetis]